MSYVGKHKIIDALTVLSTAGVREVKATPEFYVGFARYWEAETVRMQNNIGWPPLTRDSWRTDPTYNLRRVCDQEIIDRRLGDKLLFRGMHVRLASEL